MIYIYKHPEKEEYEEVFQKMNDKHVYSKDGVEWKRVYTIPQARISSFSKVEPDSYRSFSNWLDKGNGGTVGDLWDASKELSQKREDKYGKDPLKDKALKDYSSQRNGAKHPTLK